MPADQVIVVLVILLSIAMFMTGVARKIHLPHTILLVIVGILLGEIAETWEPLAIVTGFRLGPEIMLFVFLPALIFESGYSIDTRQLHGDLPPILILAIPGMLMSTLIVGLGVWWMLDIRLIVALVFGALISATDPVAVVALFKELGAPKRLMVLVEGESLLNDATAIVAFSILVGIAVMGGGIGWGDSGSIIGEFLRVFIGGVIVGSLLGFAVCEVLYRMHSDLPVILTTSIVIAYASFVLSEHVLHVSGVMSVVGSAIALKRYSILKFGQETMHAIHSSWEMIVLSLNSLLFLLVGLSVKIDNVPAMLGATFVVVVLILLARAISIYNLLPLTTRLFHLPRVSMADRHIMWWGGLKGGLAIAVVLSIPDSLPEKQYLFDLTIGVVMFTLLVSAPTIQPLMERLGLNRLSEGEDLELRNALITARHDSGDWLQALKNRALISKEILDDLMIRTRLAFSIGMFDEGSEKHEDDEYMAIFRAYQVEQSVLESLYEANVISQYVYLRMNDARLTMQEALRMGKTEHKAIRASSRKSLLERVEGYLLRYSRERPLLAKLLSRYQLLRLVQQIERHIAKVIISSNIIEMLEQQDDLDRSTRDALIENYNQRSRFYRQELDNAEQQFSGFYHRNLGQMAHRSMIYRGWLNVEKQFGHGDISAKGYNIIKHKVELELESLSHLHAVKPPESSESISDLFEQISLFDSVHLEDQHYLQKQATNITFLAGDTIVGESERGDSFYILIHGTAAVLKMDGEGGSQEITEFHDGDVIGESSLLEEEKSRHRRSATIVAKTACNLVSINHKVMHEIVDKYPDIRQQLQTIHDDRVNASGQ